MEETKDNLEEQSQWHARGRAVISQGGGLVGPLRTCSFMFSSNVVLGSF